MSLSLFHITFIYSNDSHVDLFFYFVNAAVDVVIVVILYILTLLRFVIEMDKATFISKLSRYDLID